MKQPSRKTLIPNIFGSLGYLFCLCLWGWLALLYVPMLFENEYIEQLLIPSQSQPIVAPTAPTEASPLMIGSAVIITIVVLITTIVIILRTPIVVAKTGKTITTKAAHSALPLITRGHPIPAAKQRRLTAQLIKLTKLIALLLPVALGSVGQFFSLPLPFDLVMLVTSTLALITLLWFSLQYSVARLLGIDTKYLV